MGEARTVCKERVRWLLVNIQSIQEFASHQLNRDTWCEETIQSLLSPEQVVSCNHYFSAAT